jgi:hypothetical protein
MATQRRIPQDLSGFDEYIRRAVPYINAAGGGGTINGTRLGLIAGELTDATAFLDQWYTGNPASPGIYERHSNPDTKTQTTRNMVVTLMDDFTEFFSPLLTRMGTSPEITETDRSTLNLAAPDRVPTARGVIDAEPTVKVNSFASARMQIRVTTDADASRASLHPLADAIEMRYQIGGTQPANAPACAGMIVSKKAIFNFDAGVDNEGKKFFGFVRYVNLTDPAKNGPWSSLHTGTVQE